MSNPHRNEPIQLEFPTGKQLKTAGITTVSNNTQSDWKTEFDLAANIILDIHGSVTAEEVVKRIGYPSNHPNAIGARMGVLAKRHRLVVTGYEKSNRASRHGGVVARWGRRAQ